MRKNRGLLLVLLLFLTNFDYLFARDYADDRLRDVNFFCDFKHENVNLFELKNGALYVIRNSGLESLDTKLNKLIGIKLKTANNEDYVYGTFISIDELSGRLLPTSIGYVYANKKDLYCVDLKQFFNVR